MLAIIGASGKLGGSTLKALLANDLVPASNIVACTSSLPGSKTWDSLAKYGVEVRHATFDNGTSMVKALAGCAKLFLVSSPVIAMDFDDAPLGEGREKHHFAAIDAARVAKVQHIYYSSLAFAAPSKAGVMRAHLRTEEYLAKATGLRYTVIREGLYNESWPLYLGYFDLKADQRAEIPVGGDGPVSWTGLADLGLANALVLAAESAEYDGRTFYLSATQNPQTLAQVAEAVASIKGNAVTVKVVSREEHDRYYIDEKNMDRAAVEWWSSTYDALRDDECLITDTTLESLLNSKGRTPIPVEDTIRAMLLGRRGSVQSIGR